MTNQKSNSYNIHNNEEAYSSMVASLSKKLINIRNHNLSESLSDFEGIKHKLQYIKSIEGIDFVNDSRSTNINSVWFSLESMQKPIAWIMNIDNIDLITEDLLDAINNKVSKIIIQGVYNSEILDFFTGLGKEVFFTMNLEDAVRTAYYSCKPGDVVLFSPGTTSNGIYRTYRERGDKFIDAVAQL